MKILKIIPEKCTGCMRCELACSYEQTGTFQPSKAVIRVSAFEGHTSYAPYTCPQCDEAWCLTACPVEAIGISPAGAKDVADDICVGCKLCTIACPYGTMFYDIDTHKAFKCDLCGGNPACASVCPTDAIVYEEADKTDWVGPFAAERAKSPRRTACGGALIMARHVIVGGGTAGWNAITTLRELDKGESEIVLVADETPYSRMVLPYYLARDIAESHVYIASPPKLAALNVDARLGARAERIDASAGKLILEGGDEIEYDNLLIATGSSAVKAPVPGADGKNVHSFWTFPQARAVASGVGEGARVAMIGAGFIAFTILNALVNQGVKLTVVELESRILPRMIDDTGAGIVQDWLNDRGVEVRTSTQVTSIEDKGDAKLLKFKEGPDLEVDLVIMATGIKPNIDWVAGSGLETNQGILVDEHCRTNVANIYAAGDIAEGPDAVTGEKVVHAIEPTAMQHGRVAAANMAGQEVAYKGSLLMNIVDVLDMEIASFGAWDDPDAEVFEAVRAERPAYRKLLFHGGRLTGAIILGKTREIWTTNDVGMLKGLVYTGVDISEWKEHLRENPFDVKRAFLASGAAGGLLPETVLGRPSISAHEIAISS